jgi:hypothetical protein
VAYLRYDFASETTDVGGVEWDGRLTQLPGLSLRIEDEFGGVSQISGGSLTASNADGFFDSRFGLQWDAGRTEIYFGDASNSFEEFRLLATLENQTPTKTDVSFELGLEEIKGRGKKSVPYKFYTREEFPGLREQDVGRAKQIAFGVIRGVDPVCINIATAEFKVADHPIRGFDSVKVKDNSAGTWTNVAFAGVDEANGIFRLSTDDWQDGLDVSVDFSGWVDDDGRLLTNSADVVKALLEVFGETNIDETSFAEAHDVLDIGSYSLEPQRRVTRRDVSFYLDSETELLEVMKRVNIVVGSYLTTDETGKYRYTVFRPQRGAGLDVISDDHILEDSFKVYLNGTQGVSEVAAKFGARPQEDIEEIVTVSRPLNQYMKNRPEAMVITLDLDTVDREDARRVCQRYLTLAQSEKVRYKLKLKWLGFLLRVGDQIRLTYARHGLDQVLEVLEWKPSIGEKSLVVLTLGNLHGYDDIAGFWVNADPSLVWDGTERKYKRQNAGHWHNADWFATNTPTAREDHKTSIWIG